MPVEDRKDTIAFIICVNNELYFEECKYYIERLKVPAGYDIDVIGIWEADSMCAAYNLGMRSSDAKYKVYMHQDVLSATAVSWRRHCVFLRSTQRRG